MQRARGRRGRGGRGARAVEPLPVAPQPDRYGPLGEDGVGVESWDRVVLSSLEADVEQRRESEPSAADDDLVTGERMDAVPLPSVSAADESDAWWRTGLVGSDDDADEAEARWESRWAVVRRALCRLRTAEAFTRCTAASAPAMVAQAHNYRAASFDEWLGLD